MKAKAKGRPRESDKAKCERKKKVTPFERELARLINRHSRENSSNTPDFVLAAYLVRCLEAFEVATAWREMLKDERECEVGKVAAGVERLRPVVRQLAARAPGSPAFARVSKP